MLTTPARFSIWVATGGLVTQNFSFAAYQSVPTLTGLDVAGQPPQIFEGGPGVTLTLYGTGFLPGLVAKVNGSSQGIEVTVVDSTKALAAVPGSYFINGGIYPVSVQNSDPSNTESNIQLLTVYYPSPEVQTISPNQVAVRLEPGLGPVPIEIFGFGFKRGAVALFENQPLSTSYCETDAYCLSTHLYASIPASLLRESGYARIAVRNPTPTLGDSGIQTLEIRGLEPTITSILPGSAVIRAIPPEFDMPIVVSGTNFGPQILTRIYQVGTDPIPDFSSTSITSIFSTNQMLATIRVKYPDALGAWILEVCNPGPGGGTSATQFVILQDSFEGNPFIASMSPTEVAAGGPGFALTMWGTNFQSGAQVQFYTTLLPATVIGNVIMVDIPAYLIRTAGKFPISVINPGTGGSSNRLYLNVQ
jgi:hypothetical protein